MLAAQRELYKNKANLNENEASQWDKNGMNSFHRAAMSHNLKLILEVMEINSKVADKVNYWVNSQSSYGETPLLISCMLKHKGNDAERMRFIDFMLENGSQVNTGNRYSLWTPSHWAARHGDAGLVKKLIARGAFPFTPDKSGFFPIDYAGKFEHWDTVKELVKVSIDKYNMLLQHT